MGWISYHKDGTILSEGAGNGRPVAEGEEGNLKVIVQEDYGHKVAVDLMQGVIIIDYDNIDVQGGNIGIVNPSTILYVCDETVIAGELFKVHKTKPNKDGWFEHKKIPLLWRPIWFTRMINGVIPIKVIGLQTTLGTPYKRKNVKKMVSLFPDGKIGID